MRKTKKTAKAQMCYFIGKLGLIQAYVRFGWPDRTVVVIDYAGATTDLDVELRGRRLKRDRIDTSFGDHDRRYCDHRGDIAIVVCRSERAAKIFIRKLTPVCPVYIFWRGSCVYHSNPKNGNSGIGMAAHL